MSIGASGGSSLAWAAAREAQFGASFWKQSQAIARRLSAGPWACRASNPYAREQNPLVWEILDLLADDNTGARDIPRAEFVVKSLVGYGFLQVRKTDETGRFLEYRLNPVQPTEPPTLSIQELEQKQLDAAHRQTERMIEDTYQTFLRNEAQRGPSDTDAAVMGALQRIGFADHVRAIVRDEIEAAFERRNGGESN